MVPMIWSPLAGGRIFDAQSTDPQIQRIRKCLLAIAAQFNMSIDTVLLLILHLNLIIFGMVGVLCVVIDAPVEYGGRVGNE